MSERRLSAAYNQMPRCRQQGFYAQFISITRPHTSGAQHNGLFVFKMRFTFFHEGVHALFLILGCEHALKQTALKQKPLR